MPLKLHPLTSPTASDFAALAQIKYEAFSSNPLNRVIYADTAAGVLRAWFARREMHAFGKGGLVVVHDTGEVEGEGEGRIVAYGKWDVPGRGVEGDGMKEGEGEEQVEIPEGLNMEVWKRYVDGMEGLRGRWFNPKEDFALHSLATLPEYQGRGCAGMLLRWGIEQADAAGKRAYLDATPSAYKVYCKYGWRVVDELRLDLSEFGEEVFPVRLMVREPRVVDDVGYI